MKKMVSGLLAVAMLVCLASCSLSESDRRKGREKSDDVKTENEVTSESEATSVTTTTEYEEPVEDIPAATTAVPTFPKNEGDLSLNLDEVVAVTVTGLGSDYKNYLNLKYMTAASAEKNLEKGIRNYAYIWRYDADMDNDDLTREMTVEIYIFEVDTTSELYKDLKVGSMLTYYDGSTANAAVITAINKQYVLCIYAREYRKGQDTLEETAPEFTLGNAQKGYETFVGLV